ncbi:MAG: hypothetical protein CVU84_15345 [Firmicutes bacterium HGW-Firmicutes-1]|jgi:hypothetical protein|nr:MAG: hypothetical protein CVU84_15345 [Firmicutes bacterium HGW-Firmicutes-1]
MILKKMRGILCLVVVVSLISATTVLTGATEPTKTIVLKKEEVGATAVKHSSVIRGMENDLEGMEDSYRDMRKGLEALDNLYDSLSTYKSLASKKTTTESDGRFNDMFVILPQKAGIEMALLTETNAATIATLTSDLNTINTRIGIIQADMIALPDAEEATLLTVLEYYQLQTIATQFAFLGINSANISRQREYDMFVYPLSVAPHAMQAGIDSMKLGVEAAKAGVSSGAEQLYSALLTLEGYYDLQTAAFNLKDSEFKSTTKKYEKGLVSKAKLEQATNEREIASLEKKKLERDLENLQMSLKQMLGIELTTGIDVYTPVDGKRVLNSLNYYITEALKNRSEIKIVDISISHKQLELTQVKQYFSSSADQSLIAESELLEKQLEKQEIQKTIESEIRNAYNDVLIKDEAFLIKLQELLYAKKSLADIIRYYELGYVTQDAIDGYKISVMQKEIDYNDALRKCDDAHKAIKNASLIGPGYNNEGGMSLEEN